MKDERPALDLRSALATLRRHFPGELLYEVGVDIRMGERADHPGVAGIEREWDRLGWRVQVGNESASGDSLAIAVSSLREQLVVRSQIPGFAERLAAVLREIPDKAFERENAIGAARRILEKERR